MHRDMGRIGNQAAIAIKHRAGKIQPLFDVDRLCRVGEPQAHLLGDRHVQAIENLKHHRVDPGTDGPVLVTRLHP